MDWFLAAGDREARARVRVLAPGRFKVSLEDEEGPRSYEVDYAGNGVVRSLLIDGQQVEVAVLPERSPFAGDAYRVAMCGEDTVVQVSDPLTHLAAEAGGGAGAQGAKVAFAMMPGRVVTLLVEEGATVEAGQGVLVLEAMKMENEIEAEADGVVKKLFVEPGQAVEGGDRLFELE